MQTLNEVDVIVEEPFTSGEFREAVEVAIYDHGDNELWRGSAADYAAGKAPRYRIATRLVATKLGATRNAFSEIIADYAVIG
jgi:hypothetical protein